jgi:hypothetical protein
MPKSVTIYAARSNLSLQQKEKKGMTIDEGEYA